jgi:hypothetical protein
VSTPSRGVCCLRTIFTRQKRSLIPDTIKTRDNEVVQIVPNGYDNQAQIESGLERAAKALAPDVVRIRYNFGNDWTGDPSVFFKIVLSDDASREKNVGEVADRVEQTLRNEIKIEELGIHFYFNYRSLSETAQLKEAAWA